MKQIILMKASKTPAHVHHANQGSCDVTKMSNYLRNNIVRFRGMLNIPYVRYVMFVTS